MTETITTPETKELSLNKKEKKILKRHISLSDNEFIDTIHHTCQFLQDVHIGFDYTTDDGKRQIHYAHVYVVRSREAHGNDKTKSGLQLSKTFIVFYPLENEVYSCRGFFEVAKLLKAMRKRDAIAYAEAEAWDKEEELNKAKELLQVN